MASRQQCGLIVVTRDHVGVTLDEFLPSAEQAPGRPDIAGRGHAQNRAFRQWLEAKERIATAQSVG